MLSDLALRAGVKGLGVWGRGLGRIGLRIQEGSTARIQG